MKKQLLRSVFVITAVWLLICAGYLLFMQRKEIVADRGEKLVLLNEVEQLTKNEDGSNPAQAEIEALRETLKDKNPMPFCDIQSEICSFVFGRKKIIYDSGDGCLWGDRPFLYAVYFFLFI